MIVTNEYLIYLIMLWLGMRAIQIAFNIVSELLKFRIEYKILKGRIESGKSEEDIMHAVKDILQPGSN